MEPSVPKETDNLDKDYGCMLSLQEARPAGLSEVFKEFSSLNDRELFPIEEFFNKTILLYLWHILYTTVKLKRMQQIV